MTKRSFPDVDVWFALAADDHPHHASALAWWNDNTTLTGFCHLTQLGLLRLLTTTSAIGGQPLTNEEAWRVYNGFLSDDRVRVLPELASVEDLFRSLSSARRAAPKMWADSFIAAYAAANQAILITFDQGFTHFRVECQILTG